LAATSLLPSQLEDALRELAARGLVTSDGFSAVRNIAAKSKHGFAFGRRRAARQRKPGTYSHGGRWSKFPPFAPKVERDERTEKWAWLLLRRYGVMFRDLLARESLAPTWGELTRVYRRLEMRGEIRGGRFVSGVAGEQFALMEVVDQLRKFRDAPVDGNWSVVSAVDPLNLVGILTVAARVPALRSNRVVYLNGMPIAAREARKIRRLADVDDATRQRAERLLTMPGVLKQENVNERLAKRPQSESGVTMVG
jgi:ATP-dependent Lhr-like helicase